MKLLIILILLSIQSLALANTTVSVHPIGSSPKGQYVAFEEFGYLNNSKVPFSKIKIMNVWKQQYVGTEISVLSSKKRNLNLSQVRAKARKQATKHLKEFNISG